ncbi:hypothetical protein MUO14_18935 [Halobacillus shinanisalinarum]|uniref:YfhD family protein n=1 Tax=Halobacillus shinanisalinarum TaxID=2932258 RepID=A0ABY4GX48_9BACI|nr:hypothetical protein [Halobacillus shinanisalinarum]UOQ92504.1 hypothetical protein MUO14_18935 [Halobacillus shinanisalinarum]
MPARNKKTDQDSENFKEKVKKEQLIDDDIPEEDLKQDERDAKRGEKSKNDSSSEKKYDEDFKNK